MYVVAKKTYELATYKLYRKNSYEFRKTYLLLLSTSFSSAILWERRVTCLPVATVAAPALGAVVAAVGVAAVVAVIVVGHLESYRTHVLSYSTYVL
jgi:hypothetical protein